MQNGIYLIEDNLKITKDGNTQECELFTFENQYGWGEHIEQEDGTITDENGNNPFEFHNLKIMVCGDNVYMGSLGFNTADNWSIEGGAENCLIGELYDVEDDDYSDAAGNDKIVWAIMELNSEDPKNDEIFYKISNALEKMTRNTEPKYN